MRFKSIFRPSNYENILKSLFCMRHSKMMVFWHIPWKFYSASHNEFINQKHGKTTITYEKYPQTIWIVKRSISWKLQFDSFWLYLFGCLFSFSICFRIFHWLSMGICFFLRISTINHWVKVVFPRKTLFFWKNHFCSICFFFVHNLISTLGFLSTPFFRTPET